MLLEVGSGSFGLAVFYPEPFVGCDVNFRYPPKKPMLPIRASATRLPFGDASFAGVIASDVLEHITPEQRLMVVKEVLRVTRKVAIFGFPSGPNAHALDERFFEYHQKLGLSPPDWLEEHMRHVFPDLKLFEGLGTKWIVESFGNENLGFHDWMSRAEMSPMLNRIFWILLKVAPGLVERLLRLADRDPFYRTIAVLTNTHERLKLDC